MKNKVIFIILIIFSLARYVYGKSYIVGPEDGEKLELTIYNNNTAFIKDSRIVELPAGENKLIFTGIASKINPATLQLLGSGIEEGQIEVISQDYDYDVVSKRKLLDKYVGKEIKLITFDRDNNPQRTVDAKLLSNTNGPIYEIEGEIYTDYPGKPVIPAKEKDLTFGPEISWEVRAEDNFKDNLTSAYMSGGINWTAAYNLVKKQDTDKADLNAFVNLNNRSGKDYSDAAVKLIAGKVNRTGRNIAMDALAAKAPVSAEMSREKISGYHQYSVDRPVSIENNQQKQIKLFSYKDMDVEERFVTSGNSRYYSSNYTGRGIKQDVNIVTVFNNSDPGRPLPAGNVRVYQPDSSGSIQFIGADNISHTPEGEEININTGSAFDILCHRKQTDYKKLYTNTYETEWEITIENKRKEKVTVEVVENLHRNWEIIKNSRDYVKVDSKTVKFNMPVEAGSMEKLVYRVRIKY